MNIQNKAAIIRILNKNFKDPGKMPFPAYNHVEIDGIRYALIGEKKPIAKSSEDPYIEYQVQITGTISHQKGYMPNPMYDCPVFEIDSIIY